MRAIEQNVIAAPAVSAILTDAFPDSDIDGKARPGEQVAYTATITNNGTTDATNITFVNTIDRNATLVANSVRVQPDLAAVAIRCTFNTQNGGSGDCNFSSGDYREINSENRAITGGQNSNLSVAASQRAKCAGESSIAKES